MKGAGHGVHTYNPRLREARQGNCLEFETILAYVARPVWKREERKKEKEAKKEKKRWVEALAHQEKVLPQTPGDLNEEVGGH